MCKGVKNMWTKEAYKFIWVNDCRGGAVKQKIHLEPCYSCTDRGNFKAIFEVDTPLYSVLKNLTNYYFDEQVAKKEIEAWADVINQTIYSEVQEPTCLQDPEVYHSDYFETSLSFLCLEYSLDEDEDEDSEDVEILTFAFPLYKFDSNSTMTYLGLILPIYFPDTISQKPEPDWNAASGRKFGR